MLLPKMNASARAKFYERMGTTALVTRRPGDEELRNPQFLTGGSEFMMDPRTKDRTRAEWRPGILLRP